MMKELSATEKKWIFAALPDKAAQIILLPAELVHDLCPEVFKYGPRYTQVLQLGKRLLNLGKANTPMQQLPPQLVRFSDHVGRSKLEAFYHESAEMYLAEGMQDSHAVMTVTVNLHQLARDAVVGYSNHDAFYLWADALCAVAGPEIYSGTRLEGFEQRRAEIEQAAIEFVGFEVGEAA